MIEKLSLDRKEIKKILSLAYPVIIGQLGTIMMGVVDSIMVGKLGSAQLAASSLANSLYLLVLIIAIGNAVAVTPLIAILLGAKKIDECGIYYQNSFIINLVMAFLTFAITILCSHFLYFFNQAKEVEAYTKSYLQIIGLSAFPLMVFQTNKQFIEGMSIMRPAMIVTLIANVVNAFANWLLIFGNLGMPRLELDGAGWATFISRVFMAASMLIFVHRSERFSNYNLTFSLKVLDIRIIKTILRVGIPSGFQYFFEVGAFSFAVVMVGWIGAKELAAHQIAISLASVSFMGVLGISQAGGILVGNAVGEQNITKARKAGFHSIFLGMVWMSFSGLIFILFKNYLPMIYINDTEVISAASNLLVIAALFQLSDGIQAVGVGICRGLTDVKIPTLITFVAYWVISLPVGYLLGFIFNLGLEGVWIGLLIGLTVSAILLTLRFNHKSRHIIKI
jgi:MATE family multidrug resistance protein